MDSDFRFCGRHSKDSIIIFAAYYAVKTEVHQASGEYIANALLSNSKVNFNLIAQVIGHIVARFCIQHCNPTRELLAIMIDFTILPLFLTACFFLVISPGPDLLLISSNASARGFKAGWSISLGIFIAGLVQTALVALGLGQLMQTIPAIAFTVKIIGALYLSWLGLQMLKTWFAKRDGSPTLQNVSSLDTRQLMLQGFMNNIMNPKALLFFSLFLPQFTTSTKSLPLQIAILGTLLSITALFINTGFSLGFSKLGKRLGENFKLGRHVDGILGVIFLGLAARLLTSR